MKKHLNLILSFLSCLLGGVVFLFGMLPAVKSTGNIGSLSSTSTASFYDRVQNGDFGLGIAIIVVLSCAVALALGLTIALVLVKRNKKNKKCFALASFIVFALLIAAGVMFFFVAKDVSGSSNLGSIASASVTLGYGAILAGIVGIVGGIAAGYNTYKLLN